MPAIHQFTAGFARHDAISNEAMILRGMFRRWGYTSDIFSETRNVAKTLRDDIADAALAAMQLGADDLALLHLSIGCDVNERFRTLPCRKVIRYHNITPASYFTYINAQTAAHLKKGRDQAVALAGTAALNIAVSRFNAGELEAMGYRNVSVCPFIIDNALLTQETDGSVTAAMRDGRHNILFVGRCTPNKKIEDLIRVFAYYQKTIEPHSRFIHVGSSAGAERYSAMLATMVREYRLRDFVFAGPVPQPALNAYYRTAHAFLCMSEHEGFCVPLIESMLHGVPVVAHASAAVSETMDGSGILLEERRFDVAAEVLHRIITLPDLRTTVIAGQNARLQRFAARNPEQEIRQLLAPLLPTL